MADHRICIRRILCLRTSTHWHVSKMERKKIIIINYLKYNKFTILLHFKGSILTYRHFFKKVQISLKDRLVFFHSDPIIIWKLKYHIFPSGKVQYSDFNMKLSNEISLRREKGIILNTDTFLCANFGDSNKIAKPVLGPNYMIPYIYLI